MEENISNGLRAEILIHALPYIKSYTNKIVVIKYGGNAMINDELREAVMSDIVLLTLVGVKVVLVHGGGPEITDMLRKVGKETKFVDGLRVTDAETAEIAQMVLAGKINKNLVNMLQIKGGKALGVCGLDGHLIEAKMADERLGYVGEITNINPEIIDGILANGYIPVVSTVGTDNEGNVYNINADTAAAGLAGALKAECLISLTDIAGILYDKNDESTLIPEICVSDTPRLMDEGIIAGGMIPKVACCTEAIRRGVGKVFIIDGRVPHSILIEMFTDAGIGTMFTGSK